MSKVIMVQGTMSNAGKSLITAGLCRIFREDGYHPAPFKSQNMALNSYVTKDGLEMGRAQVMQAQACGIEPDVCMNPILLKPTDNIGSQVIVNGIARGNMSARDYFAYKRKLIPDIMKAYRKLEESADIIVIEGAGSPAEINLKNDDIVNMGMAALADAPVLLTGDIDRGGVFAQLLGTMMLLDEREKARVKGLIINKFRGDKTILDPGIKMLEDMCTVPVVGVIPYMDIKLDDEDSLSERFSDRERKSIDIAVVRFPRISNFTDFNVFEQIEEVSVRYVTSCREIDGADMIILPGSKNTISDLKWMKNQGIDRKIIEMSEKIPVWGICGGFQMLGKDISDPLGLEGGGSEEGLSLIDISTTMRSEKTTLQAEGILGGLSGIFRGLNGMPYEGYEIHMGESTGSDAPVICSGNVYGTYIHGIFDRGSVAGAVTAALGGQKGLKIDPDRACDYGRIREEQFDMLAKTLREHMDMDAIYKMME